MRAPILLLLAGAALVACGPRLSEPRPVEPGTARIAFTGPGLAGAAPTVEEVRERSGFSIQRLRVAGPQSFAIIDDVRIDTTDKAFGRTVDRAYIAGKLKPGTEIEHGARTEAPIGGETGTLHLFRIPAGELSCVGMKRLAEAVANPDFHTDARHRRRVEGIYCTRRATPLSLDEARAIAAGLQVR